MGMPQTVRHWTREEVLALPDDGNRYELIDGELLVSPSPRAIHQRAVIALYNRVYPYLRYNHLGWTEFGIPRLVAEILWPSTAFNDRNRKRHRFQRSRVDGYWIVDVEARLIERWQPDDDRPEMLAESLGWQPEPAVPGLTIDLPDYFSEVLGER